MNITVSEWHAQYNSHLSRVFADVLQSCIVHSEIMQSYQPWQNMFAKTPIGNGRANTRRFIEGQDWTFSNSGFRDLLGTHQKPTGVFRGKPG